MGKREMEEKRDGGREEEKGVRQGNEWRGEERKKERMNGERMNGERMNERE